MVVLNKHLIKPGAAESKRRRWLSGFLQLKGSDSTTDLTAALSAAVCFQHSVWETDNTRVTRIVLDLQCVPSISIFFFYLSRFYIFKKTMMLCHLRALLKDDFQSWINVLAETDKLELSWLCWLLSCCIDCHHICSIRSHCRSYLKADMFCVFCSFSVSRCCYFCIQTYCSRPWEETQLKK